MNDVEEYYLQHSGVKDMKWGIRKKRDSGPKKTRAEKTNKALYKEAKGDINSWSRATSAHNKNLADKVDRAIEAKYAAKASVPVSRTVKNRGYIEAILVNSGNKVVVPG